MQLNEIKRETFKVLKEKNNWFFLLIHLIIFSLLYFVVQKLFSYIQNVGVLLYLVILLVEIVSVLMSIPLCYGIIVSFIKRNKKENVGYFDFFIYGFQNFSRAWKLFFSKLYKVLPLIIVYLAIYLFDKFLLAKNISEVCNNMNDINKYILYYNIYVYARIIVLDIIKFIAHFKLIAYTLADFILYENKNIKIKNSLEESKEIIKSDRKNWLKLNYIYIVLYYLIYISINLVLFVVVTVFHLNKNEDILVLTSLTNIVFVFLYFVFIVYILMQRIVAYYNIDTQNQKVDFDEVIEEKSVLI